MTSPHLEASRGSNTLFLVDLGSLYNRANFYAKPNTNLHQKAEYW